MEILAHRIVWSCVAVALVVTVARGWRRIGALLRRRRELGLITLASALIAVNWFTYIYGVNSDRVVETSLGTSSTRWSRCCWASLSCASGCGWRSGSPSAWARWRSVC
jgi:hypothetical protein